MLFPVTALCTLACIVRAYAHEGRRSPLVLALCAWAVLLVLASPLFFDYRVDYSVRVDIFVAACLSALTIAYLLARRRPLQRSTAVVNSELELQVAQFLGAAGVIGCVLLLVDARAHGTQFSIGYLLDNLGAIRAEGFDRLADGVRRSPLGTIGSYMATCSFLAVIAAARLGRDGGRALQLLALASFALVAVVSLMVYAGRATITNLALLVLVSLYINRRRLALARPRTLVVAAVALASVWWFSVNWVDARDQGTNAALLLQKTQRADPSPWVASAAQEHPSVGLALFSVGYFASPLPTLAFYMQQTPLPGPLWGGYSYPLPARVIGTITGTATREDWYNHRLEVFAPIEAQGYPPNVWATWLRDLLVDFGYFGAIAFCALFGAFMAWARNRSDLTGALHYHYVEVLACFTLGFGAFTSFMWDPYIANSFFLSIVIMLCMPRPRQLRTAPTAPNGSLALEPDATFASNPQSRGGASGRAGAPGRRRVGDAPG